MVISFSKSKSMFPAIGILFAISVVSGRPISAIRLIFGIHFSLRSSDPSQSRILEPIYSGVGA